MRLSAHAFCSIAFAYRLIRIMLGVSALCRSKGFVVRKDVEAALNISQPTAILLLRRMVESGLLTKNGSARHIRYYITDESS